MKDVNDLLTGGLDYRAIIDAARNQNPTTDKAVEDTAKAVKVGLEALQALEDRLTICEDSADAAALVTGAAENADLITAMGVAYRFESVSVEGALTRMGTLQRGFKGIVSVLYRAIKSEADKLEAEERDRIRQSRRSSGLATTFPNSPLPTGVVPPVGWNVRANGVYTVKERDTGDVEERITADPLVIVGRKIDLNGEGEEILSLAWKRGGRWYEQDVERRIAFQSRELTAYLAGKGAPVASDNASNVVKYLRHFESKNLHALRESKVSRRIGWVGNPGPNGFLYGSEHIAEPNAEKVDLIAIEGYSKVAAAFTTRGSIEEWYEAISFAVDYPVAMVGIYTSIASLLVPIIGVDNFIVDLSGLSSTGKTVTAQVAASVFGNPDKFGGGVIHPWDSNPAFIDRLCDFIGGGFPFILDETQRAPNDKRVRNVVYMFANGQSKGRGTLKAIQDSGNWRNVMLSTGEQPITEFVREGRAEGVGARVISFQSSPFGVPTKEKRTKIDAMIKSLLRNYGHFGKRAADWLVANRSKWEGIRQRYEALVDEYSARPEVTGTGYRIVKYFAALVVASELSHKYLDLPKAYGADPVGDIWKAALRSVEDSDCTTDGLEVLYDFVAANEGSFFGRHNKERPPREWFGAWKDDRGGREWKEVAITRAKAVEVLHLNGFNAARTLREMDNRGWLDSGTSKASRSKGRYTKTVRVNGVPNECVVIRRSAIKNVVDDAGDPTQLDLTADGATPPPF